MAASILFLIPVGATIQLPKSPLSSSPLHYVGVRGNIGRTTLTDIFPSCTSTTASLNFRGRRCLLNGKSNPTTSRLRCNSKFAADLAPAASAAYGVLLLGGGLFAYTRSGSKGSLLGGLTGGLVMAAAYFLMQAPESTEIGEALAFGSALLFASVFGIRLAATRKITPAGPLLGLSICALAVFISAYLQDRV